MRNALLVWFAGCAPAAPGSGDGQAYAAVLARADERDPAACHALRDPDLVGDCGVVVAERRIAAGASPQSVCEPVGEGVWGDECRFRAAEASMEAGDPDGAAALCLSIRSFRDACAQHLWDPALAATWDGADAETALARARTLHAEWAVRLEGRTDLDDRFWRHWYRIGFLRGVPLPADADRFCSAAPPDLARSCRKATARALAEASGAR